MAETVIQWTRRTIPGVGDQPDLLLPGYTFNPWWGCIRVSPGCEHCYAEEMAKRWGHQIWGPAQTTERRFFGESHWQEPLAWNKKAWKSGHRVSVFCASMSDVFEDYRPVRGEVSPLDEQRARLFALIEQTPWLNWLVLTKRPELVLSLVPFRWILEDLWPDNLWIGTSVEDQRRADERIPELLTLPAPVRFLSCEPLLGPVDLTRYLPEGIDWVISGGESGAQARPMDMDWPRVLRDQCVQAGVPYFFKQVGGRTHNTGGRLLDGRTWDELPPEVNPTRSLR